MRGKSLHDDGFEDLAGRSARCIVRGRRTGVHCSWGQYQRSVHFFSVECGMWMCSDLDLSQYFISGMPASPVGIMKKV